jgi:hypothetical protein
LAELRAEAGNRDELPIPGFFSTIRAILLVWKESTMSHNKQRGRGQKQKLYIFVGCFSGVVDEVVAHKTFRGAQRAFARYTGRRYEEVSGAISANCDLTPGDILGEKFDECKIFEITLRP